MDRVKKALQKLAVNWIRSRNKTTFSRRLDHVYLIVYLFEVWGYENDEQIEFFHRNDLRKILRIMNGAPKDLRLIRANRAEIFNFGKNGILLEKN